ncbi:hypothetical protein [Acidipropionibacterium acidipropionici]|uniref:hypothetical protein n=1 Tax=Acidipropionibacterium acidipropionici TaxID=1748 RepID=UPI000412E34D|nr:hypothetical protein [Acidipropionibacterium acidipropionici]ALN14343.1 hypothetical protein ASQ49_02630 [Acidipropionibacterium acidipropionici]APZ09894.1 hypothetical protein BWX38_12320 [Acidipropionibacterium acidipropionici]
MIDRARRDAAAEARIDAILAHWITADEDFDLWEQQVVRLKSLGVLDAVALATAIDDGRAPDVDLADVLGDPDEWWDPADPDAGLSDGDEVAA